MTHDFDLQYAKNLNFSACESNRERTEEALGTRMDMAVLPNPSTGVF